MYVKWHMIVTSSSSTFKFINNVLFSHVIVIAKSVGTWDVQLESWVHLAFSQWHWLEYLLQHSHAVHPQTIMMSDCNPYDLRVKCTHFCILVIGQANAGKTITLSCNGSATQMRTLVSMMRIIIRTWWVFIHRPRFIFHDSPGFETGDKKQLQEVLSFMEEKAKLTEVDNQLLSRCRQPNKIELCIRYANR